MIEGVHMDIIVVPAVAMFTMSLAWHMGGSIARGIVNALDNLTRRK